MYTLGGTIFKLQKQFNYLFTYQKSKTQSCNKKPTALNEIPPKRSTVKTLPPFRTAGHFPAPFASLFPHKGHSRRLFYSNFSRHRHSRFHICIEFGTASFLSQLFANLPPIHHPQRCSPKLPSPSILPSLTSMSLSLGSFLSFSAVLLTWSLFKSSLVFRF